MRWRGSECEQARDRNLPGVANSVMARTHDKGAFFKYYTANSAKLTLRNVSRKWSTPPMFNDPFDNQFDLHFEEPTDEIIEQDLARFIDTITSSEPFRPGQFGELTPTLEFIRQAHQQNPEFKHSPEKMAELREGVIEGMKRVAEISPETNTEIRKIMADTTIFCLSETDDNLLMWSHYADRHAGVVINFLPLREVDFPLLAARPVHYTDRMPRLSYSMLLNHDQMRRFVLDQIILTKSSVWSYEREWRAVASLRDKTQQYEILPFAPEEIGAVYLGCKIAADDRTEIIDITRRKFPSARILQAERHEREFSLMFRDLV